MNLEHGFWFQVGSLRGTGAHPAPSAGGSGDSAASGAQADSYMVQSVEAVAAPVKLLFERQNRVKNDHERFLARMAALAKARLTRS